MSTTFPYVFSSPLRDEINNRGERCIVMYYERPTVDRKRTIGQIWIYNYSTMKWKLAEDSI